MQIYSDKLFSNHVDKVEVFAPEGIKEGFNKLEKLKNEGYCLLGYLRYDLTKSANGCPLMYFEAFECYKNFIPEKLTKKIGIVIKPKISKDEYIEKINYIKDKIKNGITYEVNYTYPSTVKTNADDFELFNFLLEKQKTPYNAFINNKYETILSFSPEMFFTLKGKHIVTKPMKGTAPKGKTQDEDKKQKQFLCNDIKNRAENVMIVDLLRNDLGRIAKTGTIKVDKLFEIEEHKTLFQMTSEISAELEDNIKLYDIFKAIYPCGSITGAPKVSTMKVIEETEPYSREVYCGAIGYIHKNNAVFSVPIRILQRRSGGKSGDKYSDNDFTYHAGGAIVWDSTAEDEWEETLTKTKFLGTNFSLIETGIDDWNLHIARLKNSANELGFIWNKEIETLEFESNIVTRIELFENGNYEITTRPIPQKPENPKIKISGKVNSSNPFLYHKTSIRDSMPVSVFEEIKTNEKGQITEGIFTNIGILKNGKYYTPPVSCGLLNGVFRQKLNWEEKILYPEDLKNADKIYCFNSVRGLVEVELCS